MKRCVTGLLLLLLLGTQLQAATPSRVQGACAESGSTAVNVALTSVVSTNMLVWFTLEAGGGNTNNNVTLTGLSGGTNTTVDSTASLSHGGAAQGYITGTTGGSVTVTFTWNNSPFAVTACLQETTPGTLDVHVLSGPLSATANTNVSASAVTTTAIDYVFSGAGDGNASGGANTPQSPMTKHDNQASFPISDADATQSSSGSFTATWQDNVTTSLYYIGVMAFSPSATAAPTRPPAVY